MTRDDKHVHKAVTAWLTIDEVRRLGDRAQALGLSKAAYVAHLIRNIEPGEPA